MTYSMYERRRVAAESTRTYELSDDRVLPVVAHHDGLHYVAHVLHDADDAYPWVVTWTDGINDWVEGYREPWHAYARLAALVAACSQRVFMVHDGNRQPAELQVFTDRVEAFIGTVVHASSCDVGCDGTDPVNHTSYDR